MLRGKLIALYALIKKLESSSTNELKIHLRDLEKESKHMQEKIIQLRAKINQLETKRKIQGINQIRAS